MSMQVNLIHHIGFQWFTSNRVFVKGYFFDDKSNYYSGKDCIDYLNTFETVQDIIEILPTLNGAFTFGITIGHESLIAVDAIRSIPLFYSKLPHDFWVSDEVKEISSLTDFTELNTKALDFVTYLGFSPNQQTCFKYIYQLQAGQYLRYNSRSHDYTLDFYFQHVHTYTVESDTALDVRFEAVLKNTFNRLIQSADGRTLVVPLSGGLDSRLILAMLVQYGYEKIICYTYGLSTSYEVKLAEQIAHTLGITWYYIEYNEALLQQYFTPHAKSFREYAGNGAASPQEQEYFAVRYLTEQKLVPEDAIFVPGYCGDLPAGSYLPSDFEMQQINLNREAALQYFLHKHAGTYLQQTSFLTLKNELVAIFDTFQWTTADEFISEHENWFTQNRVSKNIVNTIRTYEFHGCEWRLPLWDKEFIMFFYQLHNEYRQHKLFYKQHLDQFIFKPLAIGIYAKTFDEQFAKHHYVNKLKLITPSFIRKLFKKIIIKKAERDLNNTDLFYQMINQHVFDGKFKGEGLNLILSSWYRKELNERKNGN
jgi:asparagine synthase (glutamine-hydrolysing)